MASRELMPGQKRVTPGAVGADLLILLWFVFSLFPILWMILLSLKSPAEQTTTYFAFSPTMENYGTVLSSKGTEEPDIPALVTIAANQKVGAAIDLMQRYSISQLPVVRDGEVQSLADVIGSLQDRDLLDRVFKNPDALHEDVATAMQPPLAAVEADQTLDEVFATLTGRTNAVVVAKEGKPVGVLTRSDLLDYLAHQRG